MENEEWKRKAEAAAGIMKEWLCEWEKMIREDREDMKESVGPTACGEWAEMEKEEWSNISPMIKKLDRDLWQVFANILFLSPGINCLYKSPAALIYQADQLEAHKSMARYLQKMDLGLQEAMKDATESIIRIVQKLVIQRQWLEKAYAKDAMRLGAMPGENMEYGKFLEERFCRCLDLLILEWLSSLAEHVMHLPGKLKGLPPEKE